MYDSCMQKQEEIKKLFSNCLTDDAKYQKIIELGRSLSKLDPQYKVDCNLVKGCQSVMYMRSWMEAPYVYFAIDSDALISAGLATIMVKIYSGETPETILKCFPKCLDDLGLTASLTPSRANGLHSIYLRMKQDALKYYMQT